VRERKRERKREKEREREKDRERQRKRDSEREGQRECVRESRELREKLMIPVHMKPVETRGKKMACLLFVWK
jgi:hypothetical protein